MRSTRAFAVLAVLTVSAGSLISGLAAAGEAAPDGPFPVAGVASFGIGSGQLGGPEGIAVNGAGSVFVADSGGKQVVEFPGGARTGTVITTQAKDPWAVALDKHGDLFVSDVSGNDVLEFKYIAATASYPATGTVVAGTGTAGTGLTELSGPEGIALDAHGNLIVADTGNNRAEEFGYNGATGTYDPTAKTIAGTGGAGSGANQLQGPSSVLLDAKGNLFVVDSANFRVMEYPVSGGSFPASGTVIASGLPALPRFASFDPAGNLFVSYSFINSAGVLEFAYNAPAGTYASSGTAIGNPGNMIAVQGLAFGHHGHLFAAEDAEISNPNLTVWNLVLEFTSQGGTFAPAGTVLSQLGRVNQGITSVATDSAGNLFVADKSVYEFRHTGAGFAARAAVIAGSGGALAVDSHRNLFAAAASGPGVLEYQWNPATHSYPASGSPVPGATQLAGLDVTAMAFDSHRDLFAIAGDQVLEFAYNGTYAATGTVLATVTGGAGGVAVDPHGNLFVSDPGANSVLEYAFSGTTGYAHTPSTAASGLSDPTGIAVDHAGDLYVFNAGSDQIMKVTGGTATAIFTGPLDNFPQTGGVTVDGAGDVFFGNNYYSAVVYEDAAS